MLFKIKYTNKIFIFTLLTVFTLYPVFFLDRYLDVGDEMLKNHAFDQGTSQWQVSKQKTESGVGSVSGFLCLSSSNIKNSVNVWQNAEFSQKNPILRLQASLRCNDVIPGKEPWDRARLLLVQYQEGKGRWDLPHSVASISGNTKWKQYSKIFFLVPDIDSLKVAMQLRRCKGALYIKNLSLKPVQEAAWYPWMQKTVFLLWGLFLIYIFYSYADIGKKFLIRAVLIIIFLIILSGTLMPGKIKHEIVDSINNQIYKIYSIKNKNNLKAQAQTFIPQASHFIFFAMFTIGLILLNPKTDFYLVIFDIIILAGATEIMQCYINGRGPGAVDFIIDIAGGLTGIFIVNIKNRIKGL